MESVRQEWCTVFLFIPFHLGLFPYVDSLFPFKLGLIPFASPLFPFIRGLFPFTHFFPQKPHSKKHLMLLRTRHLIEL